MFESKIFFRLTQVTNTYKHILASINLALDKVFLYVFTKRSGHLICRGGGGSFFSSRGGVEGVPLPQGEG